MQTLTYAALVTAWLAVPALADPAPPAPDFSARTPGLGPNMEGGRFTRTPGIDRSAAASTGAALIAPLDDIEFAPGSCALGPEAVLEVDAAARWLRAHPGYRIALEAHADVPDAPEYAEDLANRRANLVRNHLMGWGISSDRIVILVGADHNRRLVMFASDRPIKQIVTASLDHRHVLAAVWTDKGSLLQEEQGLGQPRRATVATRR